MSADERPDTRAFLDSLPELSIEGERFLDRDGEELARQRRLEGVGPIISIPLWRALLQHRYVVVVQ